MCSSGLLRPARRRISALTCSSVRSPDAPPRSATALLDDLAEQRGDIGLVIDHLLRKNDSDRLRRTDRLAQPAVPALIRVLDHRQRLAVVLFLVDQVAGADPVAEIALDAGLRVDADRIEHFFLRYRYRHS